MTPEKEDFIAEVTRRPYRWEASTPTERVWRDADGPVHIELRGQKNLPLCRLYTKDKPLVVCGLFFVTQRLSLGLDIQQAELIQLQPLPL